MSSRPDVARRATAIVRVCRRLYERGLVAGPDGNVSVRLRDGAILVTPSGMSKVDVEPGDLVLVDVDGSRAWRRPSSVERVEDALEDLSETRQDVRAVVHAHPPIATGVRRGR